VALVALRQRFPFGGCFEQVVEALPELILDALTDPS